eukprot:SAG25_NODE_3592_length_1030_cov_1.721805_2_plen_77_part_00
MGSRGAALSAYRQLLRVQRSTFKYAATATPRLGQHDQPHTGEDPHTAPLHYRRNDAMMLNNAYQETRAREPPHSRA